MILQIAPIRTVFILIFANPCVVINIFNPSVIMTKILPAT